MQKLERSLSLFNVVAISMGAMLGGEIFVLPAVAAQMTGPSLWVAYLIAAILVLPAALSQAELATAMPESGGAYLYIERTMGPLVGTIAGIGLWLSLLLKSTFSLAILGSYLGLLVMVPNIPVALALLGGVVALNLIGVRKVGRVQTIVVMVCLAILASLVLLSVRRLGEVPPLDTPWMTNGGTGLMAAVGLVFISYAGVTKIAAVAGEVKDADRNIPRGILISLIGIGILYTAVAAVLAKLFPPEQLAGNATPIASLAELVVGSWGVPIIAVTAVLALLSMANAGLLASSRFPFAMSRDRLLPDALHHVSQRFVTPTLAIAVTAGAMAVMLVGLDVLRIAKLASACMIASFCAVNLAVIIIRESGAQWYRPPFRSPLYPLTQLLGIGTGLLILVSMGWIAIAGPALAVIAGAALFLGYGRRRVNRLGLLRRLRRRSELLTQERAAEQSYSTQTSRHAALKPSDGSPPSTMVALFGREASAEALVQLGMVLAPDRKLEVRSFREVPEQSGLVDVAEEQDEHIRSLERRVLSLAEERKRTTTFDVVYTRDLRETLYDSASREHLRWVVLGWRDRSVRGLFVRNPIAWVLTQLPCNQAVFKDAGIRTYRKLVALVEPGPHDVLVARTADELATLFRAEVTLIRTLPRNAGQENIDQANAYLDGLGRLCHQPHTCEILETDDGIDAVVTATARFDMLILGAPPETQSRYRRATREIQITDHAHCAVLRLRAPRVESHSALSGAPAATEANDGDAPSTPEAAIARVQVVAQKKEQVFAALADAFAEIDENLVAADVERGLWERERQQNTAAGGGVAIPHATLSGATRTEFVVLTLASPVGYGLDDGTNVDVVLALVGPPGDRESHLRLLQWIARLVVQGDVLPGLRVAKAPEAALEAIEVAGRRVDEQS